MAEGIRIHHPTLTSCMLEIPHPGRIDENGNVLRRPKNYHIRLDADGNCIVSTTVWDFLKEARDTGFTPHEFIIVNTVANPPAQTVGQAGSEEQRRVYRQIKEAIHEIAPTGVVGKAVRMVRPKQS